MLAGFSDVTDVALLIARTPVAEGYRKLLPAQLLEHRPELVPHRERVLRPAADVIDLARRTIDLLHCEAQSPYEIFDDQHVPYLLAVPINGQRLSGRSEEHTSELQSL